MSHSDRVEFLRDLGYEEPFDESPVEVPEGWNGGAVVNTGGNIMCRVWRTWELGEFTRETEYDVIYNVSQDASVSLQAYTWDDKHEEYIFDHVIKNKGADDASDNAQAEVAKQLMEEYNDSIER